MSTNGVDETAQPTLIRLAAKRLHQISTSDIPQTLNDKASFAVIDYLGAVATGLQSPWATQVREYARSRPGSPESLAWGLQKDISAETAAFVNATLAHSAIRDDMHLKSNSHIGSIVISAALALAQRERWTGDQLLRGIIGGYEVASILGVAVQQSKGYNRHARPSGIVGAFGAAGAAIAATKVNEDVAVNALAFAANMASGYNEWAWAGGLEIYTEMGTASQSGIVAFDLAKAGMNCSESLLEGRAGLFAALTASEGESLFRRGLESEIGKGLMDVRFKPVPGCNYAQTPLAVALKLARKSKIPIIKSVEVGCTIGAKNYPGCDNPGPFTSVQQTKMSIQFGVCAVLLFCDVSEKLFQKYGNDEITAMAAGCKVDSLTEYDQSFKEGRQPARVKVLLQDGSIIEEELSDVPWLDSDAVLSRFNEELKTVMESKTSREKIIDSIKDLGGLKDCSSLFGLFKEAVPLSK